MRSKKQLAARRQRFQELAAIDAKSRCPYCKRTLEQGRVTGLLDLRVFCSMDCLIAQTEWDAHRIERVM